MATKKAVNEEAVEVTEAEVKADKAVEPVKKTVTVFLFKDNDKYKNDVFVGINGKRYQIQRGVPVEVPRPVARVLEQSMAQDMATSDMLSAYQNQFANDTMRL